jgi:hypothetical protein
MLHAAATATAAVSAMLTVPVKQPDASGLLFAVATWPYKHPAASRLLLLLLSLESSQPGLHSLHTAAAGQQIQRSNYEQQSSHACLQASGCPNLGCGTSSIQSMQLANIMLLPKCVTVTLTAAATW